LQVIGNSEYLQRQGIGSQKATEKTSRGAGMLSPLRRMLHRFVGCSMELIQERPRLGGRSGALCELPSRLAWPGECLAQHVIPRRRLWGWLRHA
jgi:hypothetical protein